MASRPSVPRPLLMFRATSSAAHDERIEVAIHRIVRESCPMRAAPGADVLQHGRQLLDARRRLRRHVRQRAGRRARPHVAPLGRPACPALDAVMSTADSPSSDTEPSDATELVVMRDCMSLRSFIVTSTRSPPG